VYTSNTMLARRRFLLASAAAVGVAALLAVKTGVLPAAAAGRRVFSKGESRLVQSLGEAMFPEPNALGVAPSQVDFAGVVDELLGDTLDSEIRVVFRYFLRVLDEGTELSRGTGFASLPVEARREVLATWSDNAVVPRRMMHDLFRLVMGMAWFNDPAVIAAIGWRAECARGSA